MKSFDAKFFTRIVKTVSCSIILGLVFSNLACVSTVLDSSRNPELIQPEHEELPSGGFIVESDPYESVDRLLAEDLIIFNKDLDLNELSGSIEPDRFEIRLWRGLGGRGDIRVFSIRADGVEFHANFIIFKYRNDILKVERVKPNAPSSGWQRFKFLLTSRLTRPKGLGRDPNFSLLTDEPINLIEVVQRGEYRRVFYSQSSTFSDAEKLRATCEFIGSEFDLDLDCRWANPSYFE